MPSVTGQLPQAADAEMETGVQKFTVESSWGQHLTDTERGGERKGEGGEGGEGRERGRTGRERGWPTKQSQ